MFNVFPGQSIRLALLYQEDGLPVSGLTNLTVTGVDINNIVVLVATPLTEVGTTGEYFYLWDTSLMTIGNTVRVYYKKDSIILAVDEYYFDVLEDDDCRII